MAEINEFVGFQKIARLDKSIIPLTNGGFALCSEEDFDYLSQFKWFHVSDGNTFYAARDIDHKRYKRMHSEIMSEAAPDHKNGDGLDNRRDNLRCATSSQNQMNRGKFAVAHSPFKGVTWHSRDHRWVARIKAAGKRIYLGSFTTETEAARAYNDAASKHFGEFARLNTL
jgi:hypothetical protein